MINPKISVIVPVYKAEAYLHCCVNSILAQTFQDFEVLLIDDGSPDKSGEICDDYAKKDTRIRVFHKENGGVSSARQCGIDNALGEYTIHVDPDDWVEPNMLEELYAKAKEEDADMVICDYYTESTNSGKTRYVQQEPSALDHCTVQKELFQQLHGSCCNKLVKRDCYKNYKVKFPLELYHCEDLYVNISLLVNNLKITYLSKAYYHYVIYKNENSLTIFYDKGTYEHDLLKKKKFCEILKNHVIYEQCEQFFIYSLVKRAFLGNLFTSKEFKQYTNIYKNNILRNDHIPFILKFFLYMSCLGFYKPSIYIYQQLIKLKKSIMYD